MNTDYMELGPTPCDENCAQVGEPDYRSKAKKEMTAYINQLYRQFPKTEDLDISFRIKWNSHDFGTYGEVIICWNSDDSLAADYVYHIEANTPEKWDEEALEELSKEEV